MMILINNSALDYSDIVSLSLTLNYISARM
jgi:hypothetical protein